MFETNSILRSFWQKCCRVLLDFGATRLVEKNSFNQKKNRDNCELFFLSKSFFYRVGSQNGTLVVRSEMNRVRLMPIAISKISEELHRRWVFRFGWTSIRRNLCKEESAEQKPTLKNKTAHVKKKTCSLKVFWIKHSKKLIVFCTENKVLAWKAIKFQKSLSDIGTKFQNRCVLSSTDETATGVIRPRQNCWSVVFYKKIVLQLPPKTCSKPVPKLVHDVARLKRHLVRKRNNTLQTLRALLRWLQAQPVPLPGASSPAGLSPLATLELEPRRYQLVAVTAGRRQRQRRHWHGKRPGGLT